MDGIGDKSITPDGRSDKHLLYPSMKYDPLNLFKRKVNNGNICEYCNVEFQDREHLERHKRVAHRKGR